MSDPNSPSSPAGTPGPTASAPNGRVQEQLDLVASRLDGLVAALDADGNGLAGRLLAHQEAWERQAEARVTANTRRVDELMVTLEKTGGSLAALERAVATLSSKLETQSSDDVAHEIQELRDELLMKQAAFVGAVRETFEESVAAETTRRTAEEAEFRRDQQLAQKAMASAVLEALDATAAADAATLHQLRDDVSEMVASVRSGLVAEVGAANATETEQVRAVLHSAIQRMVDVQGTAVRDELQQLVASFEQRLNQMTEAFQLESAVVAGLRAEFRDAGDRTEASTVAVVRDEVQSLREGLEALQEVSTRTADWLATTRSEGATELRASVVGVVQANFDKVTEMVQSSLEATAVQNSELVKAELAAFQRSLHDTQNSVVTQVKDTIEKVSTGNADAVNEELALFKRELEASSTSVTEGLTKLQTEEAAARTAATEQLESLVNGMHAELADLRTSLSRTLAEAAADDAEANADLRTDLRSIMERATSDTVSAMRSDVASIRAALGSVELAGAAAADGVAALRADHQTLRDGIRNDLEGLVAQLGFGLAATIERVDDRSVEAHREDLVTLRVSLEEALRNGARGREEAMRSLRDDIVTTLNGVSGVLNDAIESSVSEGNQRADTLRAELEAALVALRTMMRESLSKDTNKDLAKQLGSEIGSTLGSLEQVLAGVLQTETQTQEQQQRMLRDELADALAAVAQLVVDTARGEAQARTAAFDATGQRIDQLARAISAVVTAQTDLRAAFLTRFGG